MKTTFSLVAVLGLMTCGSLVADDNRYNVWQKHFYQNPDVSQFDGFWNWVLSERLLERKHAIPPLIAFVSQVVRRDPSIIKGHLDQPREFPESQRGAILEMLWYSNTDAARAVLADAEVAGVKDPPPPIGAKTITSGGDLDFCWGWFFATGDRAALGPIISTLDNGQYAGALERFKTSLRTAADKRAAQKDLLFGVAMWSLESNARDNPDITKELRAALADSNTPEDRKVWLAALVAKLPPERRAQDAAEPKLGKSENQSLPVGPDQKK